MKNTILVSITILSVCFFFIGQTSTKKDFDAEAKYRVLERAVVSLIQEKKKSDAKIEELESELNKVSARIKVHLATKSLHSSENTKSTKEAFPKNEKLSPPQSLDWSSQQRIEKIESRVRDLEIDVGRHQDFFGFGFAGGGFDGLNTLDEIKNAIKGKSDRFHSHF